MQTRVSVRRSVAGWPVDDPGGPDGPDGVDGVRVWDIEVSGGGWLHEGAQQRLPARRRAGGADRVSGGRR